MTEEHTISDPTPPLQPPMGFGEKLAFYRRRWVVISGIAIVGFFVLVVLLDVVIMPLYVKSGSVATVPAVVGMKKDTGIARLKAADYEPIEYEVRFDDKIPEGTIIRQTPEGGEETKPGRKVYLVISGGKEMAIAPDLRGKSLRDAKMALLKANMSLNNVTYAYSDSAKNGTVFQQTPAPGAHTSTSAPVSVVVSEGPLLGRVPVPDLKNMSLASALEKLKSVQLEVGKVNYQNGTPENAVLDQYPQPGDLVNEGATVDLFVARGGQVVPPEGNGH
ncbi:MAG: PASTA domain-containing protein [Bacteroidota bacterium]|nr:PASTA domain-containing protein [Bacteroidota bacterium]MDP4233548.1 PASTA domain-containing protein [Bacteroidota bacterium]MDP4243677.1 PASTA domain-containing protein [Bacteroidota bacterium]MDP4287734.1 PASTA domain-containing protein [Bacteroidota bacterium]